MGLGYKFLYAFVFLLCTFIPALPGLVQRVKRKRFEAYLKKEYFRRHGEDLSLARIRWKK